MEKTRRVIGGVETAAGVYPWIAALNYGLVLDILLVRLAADDSRAAVESHIDLLCVNPSQREKD